MFPAALQKRNRPSTLVYFWQGRNSSTDERGASALHAVRVATKAGMCPQIRVTQGKEPAHFCALFKGRMVVHLGGVAGKFDSAADGQAAEDAANEPGTRLYQVKGVTPAHTKGVQSMVVVVVEHMLCVVVVVVAHTRSRQAHS